MAERKGKEIRSLTPSDQDGAEALLRNSAAEAGADDSAADAITAIRGAIAEAEDNPNPNDC